MNSLSRSDENHQAEGRSIVGTWVPIHSIGDGEPTSDDDLRDVTLTFADSRCEVRRAGVLIRQGGYSIDSAKMPCELDVHFEQSDVPELIDATLKGIYQVDRDHLQICYGPPGGERASSFSGEKGTGQYLAKYRAAPQPPGASRSPSTQSPDTISKGPASALRLSSTTYYRRVAQRWAIKRYSLVRSKPTAFGRATLIGSAVPS